QLLWKEQRQPPKLLQRAIARERIGGRRQQLTATSARLARRVGKRAVAHHGNRRQRANRQRDSLLHGGVGNRLMASQRPAFFLDRTANREFPLPAARLGVRLSGASILVQRVQQRVLLGTRVPD